MRRYLVFFIALILSFSAYAQQDVDLHLSKTFLRGKNILKVKRNFKDPYSWVLAQNNEVYRINSLTEEIVDHSAKFAAYSSYQFIDIAGVGPEHVYIATNTAHLIGYKQGVLKDIATADGVIGVINSIGVSYTEDYLTIGPYGWGARYPAKALLVATDAGMCHYDYENGKMLLPPLNKPARVFEAIYRSVMFTSLERGGPGYTDIIDFLPVTQLSSYTIYGGYLWHGGNGSFGQSINTAYYTDGTVRRKPSDYFEGSYMDLIWGTDIGLFINDRNNSWDRGRGYNAFLKNIPITKVTSVYGLRSLALSNMGKAIENLLVGTKQGLYFSNSSFKNGGTNGVPNYDFYFCDELGNKPINDICVNATSYQENICEDGIWVAATDGLYLLRTDYAPYVDKNEKVDGIMFEGQPGVSEFSGCVGVKAVPTVNGTGLLFQWYKDGVALANQNLPVYNITSSGEYYAVLTDPCANVSKESNHLKVEVNGPPVFKFDYPDRMEFCSGSVATLSVTDQPNYIYRWYKDGQLDNNRTNVMNTTRPGRYRLELTNCNGNWVPTKEVEIAFIKAPMPIIKSDKVAYCPGEQAILTADVRAVPPDVINWQPYQYQWYKDGVKISGTTAAINVSQPGKYKVEVTACAGNTTASEELEVKFISIAMPVVSANKAGYCTGDQATLSVNFVNDGTYTINWLRNGSVLTAENNKLSINTTQPGNYTVSITSNLTSCSQTSAPYTLSFEAPPTIILTRVTNTLLCSGQAVDLTATYSGGTLKWNTGETGDRISVKTPGTYTATATTTAGCAVSENIDVQFLPNPTLNMPNATLCQFSNEKITLTAPSGFVKYEWNGQAGTAQYTTGALGALTLKVTDNNGCTATQTINITSKCKDIYIPNTFTPNGDGLNDKWLITGITGDATVTVKIYTRTGALILQSRGYPTPWDGTHNGAKVSAGVYYYLIEAKGAQQQLSGSITVLY